MKDYAEIHRNFLLYQDPGLYGFEIFRNHLNYIIEAQYKELWLPVDDLRYDVDNSFFIRVFLPHGVLCYQGEKIVMFAGHPLMANNQNTADEYCRFLTEHCPRLKFEVVFKQRITLPKNDVHMDKFFLLFP